MALNMKSKIDDRELIFRPASMVMDLTRLGSLYPYPLSFMRSLVRRMMTENWCIDRVRFDLDKDGYGDAVYEIHTRDNVYSFVIFAAYLDPAIRSDRVIAEQWDMTVTLCEGVVDQARLDHLRKNVPLQEMGRVDSSCFVLSRANKSARNFEYVVGKLASGEQPDLKVMAKVGYLYRTTAVYGSGKFGMADWQKVHVKYPEFSRPFSAEMFSCFMIRQFSLEQADLIAKKRAPKTAVAMDDRIKRYVGIGNATGLGMAPYLVNHPLLINRWIDVRETALARVLMNGQITEQHLHRFEQLAKRAQQHLSEISTDNLEQNAINEKARHELETFMQWFKSKQNSITDWNQVMAFASDKIGTEAQELIVSLLIEIYPDLVFDLEDTLIVDEEYSLEPEMELACLKEIIETNYDWALGVDFENPDEKGVFWYRSEEKMEPRLGNRNQEPGCDKEMMVDVCWPVQKCHQSVCAANELDPRQSVARFAFAHPEHRVMIRRMQTMARTRYGDIRANLLATDVLPIHLLRCKLSFFGVGKFDPRSRLWVRNTMFQGAPLQSDIGQEFSDDWCFPVVPQ
jgi:hypothetical protein